MKGVKLPVKIDRLIAIITILLNKGRITAENLAERFEVSTRTIYRDIDALSEAGIPVYAYKGNGGGIALMENFTLERTLLTAQESDSILLALKTLQATDYPEIDGVLEKIGGLFKNAVAADWVEVDFSPWGSGPEEGRKFKIIQQAILSKKVIQFDYSGTDGKRWLRIVEPLKLIFKAKSWYLRAWCQMSDDFRIFRITRMRNVISTDQQFERKNDDFKIREFGETPPDTKIIVNLHLRFQPRIAYRLYDDYEDRDMTQNEDGTIDLQISLPEDEWVYGYILSFGADVEVLEPEKIRRIICDRMQKALKFYE
jgi:predicted DNA-binding transcriptional regulator YafY